jgi:single-strand DNA-binding protein
MTILTYGVGRIGKDAVTRFTGKGEPVTGFSLAMDSGFGDNKQTLWFDCSGWGKRYEGVAPHLTKGTQVFVTGELGEREHEGKLYKTLRLVELQLVGSKPSERDGEGTQPKAAGKPQAPRRDTAPAGAVNTDPDDDIPW